ncbi:MAG: class I SAM-dependent methyltransferase [Rhizobiaceae bacterium]|nr:class I SAM-dependent methyltransferase [Rhizobiaceae bacterium]MCV0408130.1 class I SAM-dependent methyltransferase [Rhizobiaceae bacterium]
MWTDDINAIRETLRGMGQASQTSTTFQDDVLRFVADNAGKGASIVEIGCYHGGFTAQLARLAREFALAFDVIDIDAGNLDKAAGALEATGLSDHARLHRTDFKRFVRRSRAYPAPVLVFVDGDHRYKGVVADIRAIMAMKPRPYACAFHDFSLRYADGPLTNVRVDRAILDEFGKDVPLIPVGETAGEGKTLRTAPGADRHFHEKGMPEGVIVVLDAGSRHG